MKYYSSIFVFLLLAISLGCATNTYKVDSEFTGRELYWTLKAKSKSAHTGSILFREKAHAQKIEVELLIDSFVKDDVFTAKIYKGLILAGGEEVLLDLGQVTYYEKEKGRLKKELGEEFEDKSKITFQKLLELDGHVRVFNAKGILVSGLNIGSNEGSIE